MLRSSLVLTCLAGAASHGAESPRRTGSIATPNYTVHVSGPGFRIGVEAGGRTALPADTGSGLSFLGSPAARWKKLGQTGDLSTYRVTNGNAENATVKIVTGAHTIRLTVALEGGLSGDISLRTGSPGPAFGLGDRGGWEPDADLSSVQKTFPMKHDGHAHRFISSFVIFPQRGVAGACFERDNGTVSVGPEHYQMANASTSEQAFYYYIGSMEEIYGAYRETRVTHGFTGVAPKMAGFELGWESWDLLRWKTTAATCQRAIQGFLDRGYPIRWAVTGSGFWEGRGTTASFGRYDPAKYPDTAPPAPPDFGDWAARKGIRWLIGQRINFVKLGGPHSSDPGESAATIFNTSPGSAEGVARGYFLRDRDRRSVELTSTTFPTVPCYLLDGNAPGAASWFKGLYEEWGVGGVKEDTMMGVPDHTIFNRPMRLIAESGDLVMARCAAYSSPGTLTRVNDTGGARSMTLRCPINYLQYAASAAPNVYSDTVGFGGMGDVTSTLRHAWLLALTGGMAVSDSPWNRGWSELDQAKFKKVVDLHYELGPYLHSAAVDSHTTGYPHTMTPLPIAFPTDPRTAALASRSKRQFEWMIGPSLLAAPLLHDRFASSQQMEIYLPAGRWIDFETGVTYAGPITLSNFDMPLDKTPLFVGGKGVYVSRESDSAPLKAVVFPVANGGSTFEFTFPDGASTCSVVNNNTGWNIETLAVTETTRGRSVSFSKDGATGAIRFAIAAGCRYELDGGR